MEDRVEDWMIALMMNQLQCVLMFLLKKVRKNRNPKRGSYVNADQVVMEDKEVTVAEQKQKQRRMHA